MFKRIIFIFIITAAFITAVISAREPNELVSIKLYMIDAEMLRLIPIQTYIVDTDPQTEAAAILKELIHGRDSNPKIRRIIPNNENCMSVEVESGYACVNIRPSYFKDISMNRDLEYLFVYQLVNSLTSIEGIDAVNFKIDGKIQKKFKGFVDMREVFVPDYFM